MPSNAYSGHLVPLLRDAEELDDARQVLRRAGRMSQARIVAMNRAIVVICVSAWEAYIEELVRESLTALRPTGVQNSTWDVLVAPALDRVARFNTPNAEQVRNLLRDLLGLPDIRTAWAWQNTTDARARVRLEQAMALRHQIAHGVNPRPPVASQYAGELPDFFRRLGRCTDAAVRTHLVAILGIPDPWPA